MKIKHFAGYGCVNVTKKQKVTLTDPNGNKKTKLVIEVRGNHEWGLVPPMAEYGDVYDVKRWIFDKFEKDFKGTDRDIEMCYNESSDNGTDVVTYTFFY